jgi:hypothetical protein
MNQTVYQSATHERWLHCGDAARCYDEFMLTLATSLISVHQTNSPCHMVRSLVKEDRRVVQQHLRVERRSFTRSASVRSTYG